MTITKIYKYYGLPKHLQRHMLTAAAVIKTIADNWTGPEFDQEDAINLMLLHDVGNVSKMDLSVQKFSNDSGHGEDYWEKYQKEFISKYGANEHQVTLGVIGDLKLDSPRLLWLFENKKFINTEYISQTDDFALKLCAYSDMVSSPEGFTTLDNRFKEARLRCSGNPKAGINHPRSKDFEKAAHMIESQILKHSTISSPEVLANVDFLKKRIIDCDFFDTNSESIGTGAEVSAASALQAEA
jgi:hypothetical protein